jgi:archaellum component FlaC
MTLDERLERLTERHEALAQTVELIAADIRQMVTENRQMAAENAAGNRERHNLIGQIMEGIGRLLHIAEIHEHRITRLEGGE